MVERRLGHRALVVRRRRDEDGVRSSVDSAPRKLDGSRGRFSPGAGNEKLCRIACRSRDAQDLFGFAVAQEHALAVRAEDDISRKARRVQTLDIPDERVRVEAVVQERCDERREDSLREESRAHGSCLLAGTCLPSRASFKSLRLPVSRVRFPSSELEEVCDASRELDRAVLRNRSPRRRAPDRLLECLAPAPGEEVGERDLRERSRRSQRADELGRLRKSRRSIPVSGVRSRRHSEAMP